MKETTPDQSENQDNYGSTTIAKKRQFYVLNKINKNIVRKKFRTTTNKKYK